MKTAILTGSSKGIGKALLKRLLSLDYKVYGLSRTPQSPMENFIPVECDLLDTDKLIETIKSIEKKEPNIHLLVNNAGVGFFGPHEEINVKNIQTMLRTNLEVPIILTHLLLRTLKKNKGMIISISSVTAKKVSTHGCAYSASKAGLTHFYTSLFEEVRKTGVKITTIHPDMTKSNFYDNSNFIYDEDDDDSVLLEEQIADTLEYALTASKNLVVNDITLRPQKNKIKRKEPKK
ncbi:MAG TPA: SDR family NAD(P)-dependent oxidoreductase [Ruminiclostridium sp.]|jgi:short-subunit dehydrogenase|uniref:3-oxoacyl-ACP reductase n=1 Tax=Acetivibrio saccincola TaxID=1677857 RepID=A0A2K9E4Z7_9FIRM|nr:SDR family oxidoreductase [Acetivibrio saccincola]HAA42927.1 SDR family NAD(P)-dependent oxidoreductase [Ruminiclostridium sp.]AUG58459.1 Serine 3-dehydrogenase [Acetivibrio saccincola]NLW26081.1 SDR family oxidoreductase [Acetivibrio saccincola]PQQ66340.1 3-oxoacyl-ACP reductase [Acetivibrio saccincola]HOA96162.1 SDR family oxidoreductase [Acetivibrio saccincola]